MSKYYYAFNYDSLPQQKRVARTNEKYSNTIAVNSLDDAIVIAVEGGFRYIGEFEDGTIFDDFDDVMTLEEAMRQLNIKDVDIQRFKHDEDATTFVYNHEDYDYASAYYAQAGMPYAYKIIYNGKSVEASYLSRERDESALIHKIEDILYDLGYEDATVYIDYNKSDDSEYLIYATFTDGFYTADYRLAKKYLNNTIGGNVYLEKEHINSTEDEPLWSSILFTIPRHADLTVDDFNSDSDSPIIL